MKSINGAVFSLYNGGMRTVVLTDESGKALGTAEIAEAHSEKGLLHKAFSVFIFRKGRSELLIQKRNEEKRFGGLWSNTCCGHPSEGRAVVRAGERRLWEELGFKASLSEVGAFVYRAEDADGNVEYEHDTVLVGECEDPDVLPDPSEVSNWKWVNVSDLQRNLAEHPANFSPWFSEALILALKPQS